MWKHLKNVVDPTGEGNLQEIVPNILRSALDPAKARVMGKKLYRRWKDLPGRITPEQNLKWVKAKLQDFSVIAQRMDGDLWKEALEVEERLRFRAQQVFSDSRVARTGLPVSGSAHYPLLYFVVRHFVPKYIVETGVAAGYSSQAFLEAIKTNGVGRLFSTDFPLFRGHDSDRAVGVLVDEHLKHLWELHMQGDDVGLPSIVQKIPAIDVFHYDSDKSYAGRASAVSIIERRLHEHSIFIMDDIQDNSYFHDYIQQQHRSDYIVTEFSGKYVGVVGLS